MKKITKLSAFIILSFVFLLPARAAEFAAPTDPKDQSYTVSKEDSYRNLYVAASNLSVNSDIKGDLVAAGGTLTLEGFIEQDAILAAGNMFINGPIGGDAKIAGGNITISAPIGGDLVIAGGNITLSDKSDISGDLVVAGGSVTLNAPVKGSIRFVGGSLNVNSKVDGIIKATASQKLSFGSKALVSGRTYYRGPEQPIIVSGAKVGEVQFTKLEKPGWRGFGTLLTLAFLTKILAWILVGLLLFKFAAKKLEAVTSEFQQSFWKNLGIGLVSFICVPIAVILLLITVVGYYLAAFAAVLYILLLMFTAISSAIVLGTLVIKKLSKPTDELKHWQIILIGVVIWSLLGFIPVLGPLVMAVIFLATLGSILAVIRASYKASN